MKYLYGASVQGIQNFIFATNKLKEMVGASEIVEQICTRFFEGFLKEQGIEIKDLNSIVNAAGNIRIAGNKEQIAKICKYFPKEVETYAPGITISQAVEEFENEIDKSIMDQLEDKLKVQRNRLVRPAEIGWTICARSPRTGKPACTRTKGELQDRATNNKICETKKNTLVEKLKIKDKKLLPYDISDILRSDRDDWLAIIHADGNSLGKILQQLGNALSRKPEKVASGYRRFSVALDKATCHSAQKAFQKIIIASIEEKDKNKDRKYPLRPIIIGGDDLTVICRADLAIDFTKAFLENFQQESKKQLHELIEEFDLDFKEGLTACAGIAFVKESYPFHYGYHLAEELCTAAKKSSKKINEKHVPSSIAFHKVLSSFQESYQLTKKRELTAGKISFCYGPYSISKQQGMPCIEDLLSCVDMLKEEQSPKSGLRNWLSELHYGEKVADELLQRVSQIAKEKKDFGINQFEENLKRVNENLSIDHLIVEGKTPIFDMLTILSLGGQK